MPYKVESLCFSYGKKAVLEDVNFSLRPHSILSILGANGSGKSTLLNCLNHFLEASAGEILLFGKDIKDYTLAEKAKYIAYVRQETQVYFPITAMEMILQGRLAHRRKLQKEDYDLVSKLISRFHLEDFAFRNVNELSGGERQLILIARALAQEPKILILDEPTAALDVKNQLFLLGELEKMVKEEDLSILMTIHDLNLASMFSDEILALANKKVYAFGPVEEVLNEELVSEIYGVKTKVWEKDSEPYIQLLKESQ